MKKIVIVLAGLMALLIGFWAQQALKADFISVDGQKHRWSNAQEKWQVVNYFAEWCAPCLREIPELNHFYQLYSDEVDLFAISFDPLSPEQLISLQKKYAIEFPIIQRLEVQPWGSPPSSLPTTFILDANGNVKKQLKGEQSAEKLMQTINLLKAL